MKRNSIKPQKINLFQQEVYSYYAAVSRYVLFLIFLVNTSLFAGEATCRDILLSVSGSANAVALNAEDAVKLSQLFSDKFDSLKGRLNEFRNRRHKMAWIIQDEKDINAAIEVINKSKEDLEKDIKSAVFAKWLNLGIFGANSAFVAVTAHFIGLNESLIICGAAGIIPATFGIASFAQQMRATHALENAIHFTKTADTVTPGNIGHLWLDAEYSESDPMPNIATPTPGYNPRNIYTPEVKIDFVVTKNEDGKRVGYIWVSTDNNVMVIPNKPGR
jgi:hypothetical protein